MGFLDSIKGFASGLLGKTGSILSSGVSSIATPLSGLAQKVDNIVPHPKGGGFQNVVDTLAAPFTGGHVSANVSNPVLKSTLELVSNNPFKVAGIAAGGITAIKQAPALISAGKSALSGFDRKGVSSMATAGGGIIKSSPSISSPGQTGIVAVPSTPSAPSRSSNSSPRRKSSKAKRTTSSKRPRNSRRQKSRSPPHKSKKKHYGSAKQYSRKGGKKVYYAKKTGQPYILKSNGQAVFIKGKRKKR